MSHLFAGRGYVAAMPEVFLEHEALDAVHASDADSAEKAKRSK